MARRSSAPRVCSFEGCDRGVKSRGLCNGHYQQDLRGASLTPLRVKRGRNGEVLGTSRCQFAGCAHFAASWGLCDGHYQQKRQGYVLTALQVIHETCTIRDCDKPHDARGYCTSHYSKWRLHGDPLAVTRCDPSRITEGEDALHVHLGGETGRGKVALISPADREMVEGHSWWLDPGGYAKGKPGGVQTFLHGFLMAPVPLGKQVDHINGVRLDNRRENLRIVTQPQQMQNKKPWGKSGHRNVFWEEKKSLWRVLVQKDGVKHSGGRHKELEDAIVAAKALRAKLFTHHNEDRCQKLA